jgi:hypothetical protein
VNAIDGNERATRKRVDVLEKRVVDAYLEFDRFTRCLTFRERLRWLVRGV